MEQVCREFMSLFLNMLHLRGYLGFQVGNQEVGSMNLELGKNIYAGNINLGIFNIDVTKAIDELTKRVSIDR